MREAVENNLSTLDEVGGGVIYIKLYYDVVMSDLEVN